MEAADLLTVLRTVFGEEEWPKPLHLLYALERLQAGELLEVAARNVKTSSARLAAVAQSADPFFEVLGLGLNAIEPKSLRRAQSTLGRLVLGRAAELAFEEIYRTEMPGQEFQLVDLREGRTDTDYRLLNGQGRRVYRVNIKFHGSQFRKAQDMVGLQPDDCFALATYKVASALQKQQEEGLPYLFAIVGVPNLTNETVGANVPAEIVDSVALIHQAPRAKGKRDFEDKVVDHLVASQAPVFRDTLLRLETVEWYILSARRADQLLRKLLFERVYALRIPRFAQTFGKAELDMHFSVSQDLTPFRLFLRTLRDDGPARVTTLLERGEF